MLTVLKKEKRGHMSQSLQQAAQELKLALEARCIERTFDKAQALLKALDSLERVTSIQTVTFGEMDEVNTVQLHGEYYRVKATKDGAKDE